MNANAKRRAAAGAALLDKKAGGWVDKIELDLLDMGRGERNTSKQCGCVMVQLGYDYLAGFGYDYLAGLVLVFGHLPPVSTQVRYGLRVSANEQYDDEIEDYYDDLDEAWTAEILARRG